VRATLPAFFKLPELLLVVEAIGVEISLKITTLLFTSTAVSFTGFVSCSTSIVDAFAVEVTPAAKRKITNSPVNFFIVKISIFKNNYFLAVKQSFFINFKLI
jgi:hypothetical protein